MGTNQLSESAYIDQLRIENHDQPPSASGVLSVSVLNIVSRGRQSGRDLYTVNLEIMNHGGRKLTFKSGVFRYTVYDPPGRKTTEQKISYRVADLDPGLKTGIGNSCEGPPPDYVGTWSAEGTAVDPVTQEVHTWKINGTCP
ncbi:MAG: hypothetical protein EX260_11710 [Desulfobulbaceae bacterium]|nr:MAG: hypothetical protein EX260_11710 [Desulfobulbaceae bacterium]